MSLIILTNRYSRQRGFTLMEALIGFLILSIGMLGIASLQAVSLKAGKTSVYNSVAMLKVDELLESMRANSTALAAYGGAKANNLCTASKTCTPEELAADDLFWWHDNMQSGLPSTAAGSVEITAPVAPSKMAQVKVTITWKERKKDALGSEDKTFAVNANICTDIPC